MFTITHIQPLIISLPSDTRPGPINQAMKPATPKPGPSSSVEGTPTPSASGTGERTRRKRKQKREDEGEGESQSAESSNKTKAELPNGDLKIAGAASAVQGQETGKEFEEGADFIGFGIAPDDDEDAHVVRNKGKGKVREWGLRRPMSHEREKSRSRSRERRRDDNRGVKRKFDPDDGYANKKQRTDAASRKAPWINDYDWTKCHHVAELLHQEVLAFTSYISPSQIEDELRSLVVSLISHAITSQFPDATVHPFGSYQTKLYLPLGDIDLVILSKSMAYNDKTTVLHALASTLRRAGITDRVTIIGKAKVPIVKFVTNRDHGRFNVDISVNQENGITAGDLINGFLHNLHRDPGQAPNPNPNPTPGSGSIALRSLVLITKLFLSQRSMNEVFSGGLGSYSIVCLAISFLQMHPKIRRGEINPDENLGVLVMEFFELYGCYFNYGEVGISVRGGGMYFRKRERGWGEDLFPIGGGGRGGGRGVGGRLSIEDPADPSNDISRGSYAFQKVRQTFAGAYSILSSSAYLAAGIISSKRQGRYFNLRGDEPEELSILASVLGVTQETINHRKLIQELYDKRTLHNIVHGKGISVNVIPLANANDSGPSSTLHANTGDRDQDRDRDRDRSRRDRDRDRERRDRDGERERGRSRKERGRDESKEKDRERDRDRGKERDRDRGKERDGDKERDRDRGKERDRDRGRERDKDKDKERDRDRDRDRTDRNRDRKRPRESDRDHDHNHDTNPNPNHVNNDEPKSKSKSKSPPPRPNPPKDSNPSQPHSTPIQIIPKPHNPYEPGIVWNPTGEKDKRNSKSVASVAAAWREAEYEKDGIVYVGRSGEDDGEVDEVREKERRRREEEEEEEEGGRYKIRPPPAKRRRLGDMRDEHVMFVNEDSEKEGDDEDEEEHWQYFSPSGSEEIKIMDGPPVGWNEKGGGSSSGKKGKKERDDRRSYWLSKGIGIGGGGQGSEEDFE